MNRTRFNAIPARLTFHQKIYQLIQVCRQVREESTDYTFPGALTPFFDGPEHIVVLDKNLRWRRVIGDLMQMQLPGKGFIPGRNQHHFSGWEPKQLEAQVKMRRIGFGTHLAG
jgi:hypothetical protein